jgi:hypothetical protein
MRSAMTRRISAWLLATALGSVTLLLSGCVTPIALDKESPDVAYKVSRPISLSVLDDREWLREGKPPTFIGRAHGVFGIPSDMETYPWLISDKTKKGRIALGLNDEGWKVTSIESSANPDQATVTALLTSQGSERLVVLTLTQWFISVNLNWVGAFNFDWGYRLAVYDQQGKSLLGVEDQGRDVVDMQASESPQNMIKMAFRARLIKILERPDLQSALEQVP